MRAAVEGNAEALRFRETTPADPVRRLDQREASPGRRQPARRRDPRRARADDDAIHLARARARAACARAGRAPDPPQTTQRNRRGSFGATVWLMDWSSWFAIGFTLRCDERNSWQNQRLSAKPWLTIHCHATQSNEPNCNKSRLNWQAMRRRAGQNGAGQIGFGCHALDAQRHRANHRPISGTRGGGLRALHAERPGGIAGRAAARRRAAGRRQQSYFRRHQVSHPIDLVARRALCRADRRAHRRRRRAAGAGRGRPRPGRGRRAAVEIPALPHPHLPPDRADRGRLRAGLHLRRRAHRLRLRREEHLRPAALSVPAAGAAALAAAHDGARLRPSDPHHLLGADRAGVRARALSDPAEGHPPGKRGGAPRDPRDPPFVALRAARFRHLALFRAGQADHRARLRLPPHGLGASAAHP